MSQSPKMLRLDVPPRTTIRQWSDGYHYVMYAPEDVRAIRDWLATLVNQTTQEAIEHLNTKKQAQAAKLEQMQNEANPLNIVDKEIAELNQAGEVQPLEIDES